MRIALLVVLTLIPTGCWKTIHEADGPPAVDRQPVTAGEPASGSARRV